MKPKQLNSVMFVDVLLREQTINAECYTLSIAKCST